MIRYFRATDVAEGAWLRYDDATGQAAVSDEGGATWR